MSIHQFEPEQFEARTRHGFEILPGGSRARIHVFNENDEEILIEFPWTQTPSLWFFGGGELSIRSLESGSRMTASNIGGSDVSVP
jgi:hypothetical protein